ncbi:MAG TPA: rhomboid family intramembrane serine protease [Roseiflexaceae bacterium]|nr:rhomboid family intramembrane serine protease [Roseiflexaceae bacterium]HMP40422.1 rhomboid family intramembrane serine protease [Roseiflexaceae bacterium]
MTIPASSGDDPQREPPGDDGQIRHSIRIPFGTSIPIAGWVLLVVNIVIWAVPALLTTLGVQAFGLPLDLVVLALGWKDNAEILNGAYYRLITATFLHSSLMHIGFNAYAIYALGFHAERVYGTPRFLALYFLAGLGGSVASYMFNPSPAVGASGAVFGMVGGLAVFYYVARGILGESSRQMIGNMAFIVLINLGFGLTLPSIDNFGHIGGLIAGMIAGAALAPRYRVAFDGVMPVIQRMSLPFAWPAALALLAGLIVLVMTTQPPLR